MALVTQHFQRLLCQQKQHSWRMCFTLVTISFLNLSLLFFGLMPCPKMQRLHEYYIYCWMGVILAILSSAYFYYDYDYTLGGVVSAILFVTKLVAHVTILMDTRCMYRHSATLQATYTKIEQQLREGLRCRIKLTELSWTLTVHVQLIMAVLAVCHAIVLWTTLQTRYVGTALTWYSFPSLIALQLKTLEFFASIAVYNGYVAVLKPHLRGMCKRNMQSVLKMPAKQRVKGALIYVLPQEVANSQQSELEVAASEERELTRQLLIVKSLYSDIYTVFEIFNKCHGWSLLAITAMYFTDLVCKLFWFVLALIKQGSDQYEFLIIGGIMLGVVVQLTLLCWHCQQSSDNSYYIGGLIYKLVKPLGNKRYNDLVSEFALQVLHQRFVITAKKFFELNLNLLGNMVAAIVTYLVILIQFLFTEKNKTETPLQVKSTTNST